MKFALAPHLFALGAVLLPSVLATKDIHELHDCAPYTAQEEANEGPLHYTYRPIAFQMNDPTEHDGKFKKMFATLYGRSMEFTVYWGDNGRNTADTMIQMTANPNDGRPSLQSEFLFKWSIAGGATYKYKLGWDDTCGLLGNKVPFTYHDVREIQVLVKETTCKGLGCH